MFIQTKTFASFALIAPLFVGCTINTTDDDDTAGGTAPTTTDTPTSGDTEEPGSESGAGEGSESGESGAGESTGGGGDMFCQQECTVAADCCGPGSEDMCPGDYPYNVSCSDAGTCEYGGCADAEDCAVEGYDCLTVSDFNGCYQPCGDDEDCTVVPGTTCTGTADDGMTYCEAAPCTSNEDCGTGVCLEDGSCDYSCADSSECVEGFVCV